MRISALLALGLLLSSQMAGAQGFRWPEEPENLQVLPESAKGRALGQIMRGFAGALGVRCEHCHVGEGNDLSQYDFAADDKLAKQKARIMIEMVIAINTKHLRDLDDIEARVTPALQVECRTCHRGNTRPEMIDDIVRATIDSDGLDEALATYRELREENYGGFTYDFSPGVLTRIGEEYSRAGDTGTAIRLIEADIEINGETFSMLFQLGQTQKFGGMTEEAIESFTRGMELADENWKPFFQREIDRLRDQE